MKGLSKGRTLNLLNEWGFNVPHFVVFHPTSSMPEVPKSLIQLFNLFSGETISIRTWRENEFKCPFSPNKDISYQIDWLRENWETLKNHEEIIISEGIDPSKSLRAGKAVHLPSNDILVEYYEGPGTVRDMETMDSSRLRHFLFPGPFYGKVPYDRRELMQLAARFRKFFMSHPERTIEWSQYPYKIGRRKEEFIFWEVL